ncbi:MAG: hypothetical protein K2O81_00115 [Clostridia bacterium]|nr:hypothetical protein [Clostridia bacterium]
MEKNNNQIEDTVGGQAVPLSRKLLLEFKDILAGVAFPLIVMLVISSTILAYASYAADLTISLIALIGGEIMISAALVIFGRANGGEAYRKTVLHAQKRALGNTEDIIVCKTGEYSLWKGVLIGAILCLPFLIFQTIELCYSNAVCSFCLQYMCGWAYFPFSYLGKNFQALNYILVILPVGAHTLGYHLGKIRQQKIQQAIAETNMEKKGRKK